MTLIWTAVAWARLALLMIRLLLLAPAWMALWSLQNRLGVGPTRHRPKHAAPTSWLAQVVPIRPRPEVLVERLMAEAA